MNMLIKVLIVDDSAFVRKVVKEMLGRSPLIDVVGVARDGAEALTAIETLRPNVVTCDLMMPGMDGAAFVREQMKRAPLPILILTATPEDGEKALEAMEAGAVDIVQKPTARATNEILAIRDELIEKVKAAAQASPAKLHAIAVPPVMQVKVDRQVKTSILLIGISTGGPQALRYLIPQFPADFPVPIAMVLHMPVGYTEMFAQKLDELSQLKVIEAREGTPVQAGTALLAPAGRHLVFRRSGNQMVAQLSAIPLESPHRPSVDVLFQSAAECYGSGVMGVVMTGMGDDGKKGSAWIKAKGGTILTEAEQSCVIYGMPRSVVDAGLSDASAPLTELLPTIMDRL